MSRHLKLFIALCLVFWSASGFAQTQYSFEAAVIDFNNIIGAFLQLPTEPTRNEAVYIQLESLQNFITNSHVSQEDRYRLNSLQADINVLKEFISPVSGKYNAHLSSGDINRLHNILGEYFTQTKLNVKCSHDEIEFVEIKVGTLVICYFHCISKKTENGIRIKFHVASGNSSCDGEYGALKGEYTPILHNVGMKYLRVRSATIIKRF